MDADAVGKVIDKVATYLDALAVKLGVGVGKIWPWFVKQQYVEGVRAAVIFATFLPLLLWILKRIDKVGWETPNQPNCIVLVLLIIFGIGTLFGFIDFLAEFPDIFNAEYWAFKELLNAVK